MWRLFKLVTNITNAYFSWPEMKKKTVMNSIGCEGDGGWSWGAGEVRQTLNTSSQVDMVKFRRLTVRSGVDCDRRGFRHTPEVV